MTSSRRLMVRVRSNLEWVLGPEESGDEPPIALWAEHTRDDGGELLTPEMNQRRAQPS
jgi:hypothetical protein